MSPPEAKLSHNWTVAGARSTTGKPILESDPQYSVDNPSFWYEVHLCGGRYNVRGIGVPGAPGLLIGWNERIAWGVTGLGGDDADLFCEKLNPENSTQYAWQGQWREFVRCRETILVKDGPAIEMEIRQTHHGPIVDELLAKPQKDRVFALQHALWAVPKCSLGALLELMRAMNWATFRQALSHYVGPPGHFIYADVEGNIGYQAGTTTPKRRGDRTQPRTGWTGEDEWELLPFDETAEYAQPGAQLHCHGQSVDRWIVVPLPGWQFHRRRAAQLAATRIVRRRPRTQVLARGLCRAHSQGQRLSSRARLGGFCPVGPRR